MNPQQERHCERLSDTDLYIATTDEFISFKLLIVNVFGPAVLLKARESLYCTQSSHACDYYGTTVVV